MWVRIPRLPIELCNDKFLTRVGNALGTMLKVDRLTSLHERGKFAHICVELDLDEPLDSHISVRGKKLYLEYEGLHSICFRCGKYGNKKDKCRELLEVEEDHPSSVGVMEPATNDINTNSEQPQSVTQTQQKTNPMQTQPCVETNRTDDEATTTKLHNISPTDTEKVSDDLQMGPWNIPKYVAKRKKQNQGKGKHKDHEIINNKVQIANGKSKVQEEPANILKEPEIEKTVAVNESTPKPTVMAKSRIRNPMGGKTLNNLKGKDH